MNDKNNTTQLKEEELKDVQGGNATPLFDNMGNRLTDSMCKLPGNITGMPNVGSVTEMFESNKIGNLGKTSEK